MATAVATLCREQSPSCFGRWRPRLCRGALHDQLHAEKDGTRKRYFLAVPPTMKTARKAVAWTFGMSADEYKPEVEK